MMIAALVFMVLSLVAPEDGTTVSLLKDAQREYLSLPAGARREQMGDATARAKFAKCGGRPAAIALEWSDSDGTDKSLYVVELKCIDTGKSDRFEITGMKAELVNLEVGRNYQWSVAAADRMASAKFTTADTPRLMLFPGVANCRDLGGKSGLNGKRLCQGRVYRTAAYNGSSKKVGDSFLDTKFVPGPNRITKAGRREMVETCGVKTDIDLRSSQEVAGMVTSPLGTNVVWSHIPIRAYGWLENDKAAIGKILKMFADESNYPIAFHCSGGRDRAGSLAFILEGLCGVSEDELMRDWELSIFDTDDLGFAPARIDGLVDMLKRYQGDSINARVESFVKACGLGDDDVAKIRSNLLEK